MKDFKSYSKPEIQTILLGSLFSRGFCCYLFFLFFFLSVFQFWCWLFLFLFLFFFFWNWIHYLRFYDTVILLIFFGFEDFSSISTIRSAKKHILIQRIFWSDSFCEITSLIDQEPTPQTWKIWFYEFVFHPVWSLVSVFI